MVEDFRARPAPATTRWHLRDGLNVHRGAVDPAAGVHGLQRLHGRRVGVPQPGQHVPTFRWCTRGAAGARFRRVAARFSTGAPSEQAARVAHEPDCAKLPPRLSSGTGGGAVIRGSFDRVAPPLLAHS